MVAQFGKPENNAVCFEMHEVLVVKVVCNAKAMPSIVNVPLHEHYIPSKGISFMRGLVVVQDEAWAVLCL